MGEYVFYKHETTVRFCVTLPFYKEIIVSDRKEYFKKYNDNRKENLKLYYLKNREKCIEYRKEYYKINIEKCKEYDKQYRETHKEQIKEYESQYWKTLVGKQNRAKSNAKRKELGFCPLNESFKGCEAHHISENFVIFIPVELHQSLFHNVWTWKNMEQINKLAVNFMA